MLLALICDLPLCHPKNLFHEEAKSLRIPKKEPNFTTVKNPLEGEEISIYFSRRKTMQWGNSLLEKKKKVDKDRKGNEPHGKKNCGQR